jgi:uncharacterized membrane protein
MNEIEFFEDEKLTRKVTNLVYDEPTNAGETKVITIFAKNSSPNELRDIQFQSTDKEVTFDPEMIFSLQPSQSIQLKIIWKPRENRKDALKTKIYAFCKMVIRP